MHEVVGKAGFFDILVLKNGSNKQHSAALHGVGALTSNWPDLCAITVLVGRRQIRGNHLNLQVHSLLFRPLDAQLWCVRRRTGGPSNSYEIIPPWLLQYSNLARHVGPKPPLRCRYAIVAKYSQMSVEGAANPFRAANPKIRNTPARPSRLTSRGRVRRFLRLALGGPSCPGGGTGRRAGFRYQWSNSWRFESSPGHHSTRPRPLRPANPPRRVATRDSGQISDLHPISPFVLGCI